MTEYIIIVALIAVAAIAAFQFLGKPFAAKPPASPKKLQVSPQEPPSLARKPLPIKLTLSAIRKDWMLTAAQTPNKAPTLATPFTAG